MGSPGDQNAPDKTSGEAPDKTPETPSDTASDKAGAGVEGPEGAWAKVGEKLVFKADAQRIQKLLIPEKSRRDSQLAECFDIALIQELTRQGLDAAGIARPDSATVTQELRKRMAGSQVDFAERLQARGQTLDEFRAALAFELRVKQVLEPRTTDEKVLAYYKRNKVHYVRQVRVSRIFIAVDEKAGAAAVPKARNRAEALIAKLDRGEDFTALCRKESDDPLAPFTGGDLGWVFPDRLRQDAIVREAKTMKLGEHSSKPLYSRGAYHILRITEERVPDVPFTSLRDKTQALVRVEQKAGALRELQREWLKTHPVVRYRGAPEPTEAWLESPRRSGQ